MRPRRLKPALRDINVRVAYLAHTAAGVVTLQTEEVSTDNLAPLEVVVRNEATLVSAGTELARLSNGEGPVTYPYRSGYTAVGRLVAKGAAVTDFQIGDRVFYAGKHGAAQRFLHGANHQWNRLYPVPEDLPVEDAVFGGLAEISMTAPCVTQLSLNDTVAVFGLGLIGNLAAQLYRIQGARVIALDPVSQRCEQARAVGLTEVINAPPDQQVATLKQMTGGRGADVTVDAVGHSAVIENCIAATALYGQIVLLGTPRAEYIGNLTKAFNVIHTNGLVLRGAHMWRFPAHDLREVKETVAWGYRNMFQYLREGRLKVAPLRSHFVKPTAAQEMYRGLQEQRDKYWGVVFDWR